MAGVFQRFAKDRSGATAIEYAMIAAFLATAIIAAMPGLTTKIGEIFTDLAGHMDIGNG